MKLETNQAWQQASEMVAANRQVLLAMAGVFFVLPSLAVAVFVQEPQMLPNMTPKAMMGLMGEYYLRLVPWIIPAFLASSLGTLALLSLITDPARPTVGEAIRSGVRGLLPYLGTQLLITLAFLLIGLLVGGLGAATGSAGLAVLLGLILLIAAIYVGTRLTLAAPVIVVDGQRNPVAALLRSWTLTQGNAGRILLFVVLLVVVFGIVMIVAMAVLGAVLALTLGGEPARIIAAVASSALGAAFTVFFTACIAAIHRQLTGGGSDNLRGTFD
jgi:hypothetical protein